MPNVALVSNNFPYWNRAKIQLPNKTVYRCRFSLEVNLAVTDPRNTSSP